MTASTKLTITIPDELAQRLEPLRNRMNISAVCAKALEAELALLQPLAGFEQAAEQLRERASKVRNEAFYAGVEAAREWLATVEISEAHRFVDWYIFGEPAELFDGTASDSMVKEEMRTQSLIPSSLSTSGILESQDARYFLRGWLSIAVPGLRAAGFLTA